MNKFFYARLAASNIRKNSKMHIPFLITSVLTIAMFYILMSLSLNEGLCILERGSTVLPIILRFGCYIVGIFAVIFLFYTYSFLMKRRQKEFGLFNILGMEKKHIAKIIALETLYTALISIVVGLLVGMLLDKLMYMLLLKMISIKSSLDFYISFTPILITVILFTCIFILLFLYSMFRVRLTNPIQLLHGGQVGEKEPKTKIIMAIIGLVCLGIGYYLSIATKDALDAISLFFIAVIFVIIGTYFLFVAGSIALLKMLRKNKKYYYKTNHFISISGMLYRMKKNAVGLANICILSTMVLVMISTTLSMIIGLDDVINLRYPYDMNFRIFSDSNSYNLSYDEMQKTVNETADKHNMAITEELSYKFIPYYNHQEEEKIIIENYTMDENTYYDVVVIPVSDYNRCTNHNESLSQDEVILYTNIEDLYPNKINYFDTEYKVSKKLSDIGDMLAEYYSINNIAMIVNDEEFNNIDRRISEYYAEDYVSTVVYEDVKSGETKSHNYDYDIESYSNIEYVYNFNITGTDEEKIEFYNECNEKFGDYSFDRNCRSEQRKSVFSVYGGLFFIAVFLGTLFVGAMILIIYYKQITEGYEDREGFDIMQKVGLSYAEAKKAIRSQILTVFFLPLITAGIHIIFALPMISRILSMMTLGMKSSSFNTYIWCTVICFLAFAVLYAIIYMATAKTYYRIVKWKNTSNKN